jgi:Cu-processing system permease protein
MTDWKNILIIAQKELNDALRNRWLQLYAGAFGALALAIAWLTLSGPGIYGPVGFGRAAANLINLVILIVPLMGLTLGASSIAGEREKGSLSYMLTQPVSRLEILLGKYVGLALSLMVAVLLGFGISGLLLAFRGGAVQVGNYVSLVGLSFLLGLVALSLGFLLSVITRGSATATGSAIFLWLSLVFLTDLGIMGTAVVLELHIRDVFLLSLLNPLQVFKLASIIVLSGSLDLLGPGGIYAIRSYGDALLPALLAIMAILVTLPLSLSCFILQRKNDL